MFTVPTLKTRAIRLLAAATIALSAAGCQPPADTPPPVQPTKAPTPVSVSFVAEVVNLSAAGVTPLKKRVAITITGVQADGKPAKYEDPDTHQMVPGPKVIFRTTPFRYDATFAPGVVAMSFRVDYLGLKGEEVICKTLKNGQQVQIHSAAVDPGPRGRGAAVAFCEYVGN